MQSSFSDDLLAAAKTLLGGDHNDRSAAVLRFLGYDDGDDGAATGRAAMLRAGATFRRLFTLPVPDAPGLIFFGAEADPATMGEQNLGLATGGFAGSGLTAQRAFESCVGEGVEYLSQFAQADEGLASGPMTDFTSALDPGTRSFVEAVLSACGVSGDQNVEPVRGQAGRSPDTSATPTSKERDPSPPAMTGGPFRAPISWIPMRRLPDGAMTWYPADLCLRRGAPDFLPPLKLSTGCAAGVTLADATLRALLELIERDALALWWRGGKRPRAIPATTEAGQAGTALLAQLRQGASDRRTHLLDITTDLDVPVVVAFSTQPDGYGFAFGLAARTSLTTAVRSAIFEMCQSKLSLHVIAAKRNQSGDAALNDSDKRQWAWSTLLDTNKILLLKPEGVTSNVTDETNLESILRRLAALDIIAYSIDLTRARFGIPVVRVIAPNLQNEPCTINTDRLTRMIANTGGGARHTGGVTLL